MWANRGYILIATLVFVIALIVQTPLQLAWPYIQPKLQNIPVTFSQIKGTLWQGEAQVQTSIIGMRDVHASWVISPWSLLTLTLKTDLKLKAAGLEAKANLQTDRSQTITLSDLNVYLHSSILKPMLNPKNVHLAGEFNLNKANAKIALQEKKFIIHQLDGQVVYSGGQVGFPVDGNPIQATLPMLIGTLNKTDNKAVLQLTTTDQLSVGQGYIQPDGWAGMAVKRRFLDILQQPWPAKAQADTVIFEVSQKIF